MSNVFPVVATVAVFGIAALTAVAVAVASGWWVYLNAPPVGGEWWPYIRATVTIVAAVIGMKIGWIVGVGIAFIVSAVALLIAGVFR